MDVIDLQLLDWLIWDNVTPCQVTAIGCDYIETTKCGITLAESHLLKGIPLTPEILEKNGFENDFYHDESVADYHFVRLEGYSYREDFILVTWCNGELNVVNDLIGEVKIHCENIHELQHALRLCGIDKEIEI